MISTMMPEVSVVVPTVVFDDHFHDAVSSVLDSVAVRIELIVVCDGIADGAPKVLSSDPRVRLIYLPTRRGTPYALNAGIEAATSDVIARLDADDLTDATRFKKQIDYLRANPDVTLVGSRAHLIDAEGKNVGRWGRAMGTSEVASTLLRRNPLIHSSVMYHRADVVRVGGYSVDCTRMQDYELFLRLAWQGSRLAVLDEELISYRLHNAQHSRNSPPRGPGHRLIQQRRDELGKALGLGPVHRLANRALWWLSQTVRHLGWRKPRHLRGIGR